MIELEILAVPEGQTEHTKMAGLVVADDGTYQVENPDGYLPVDLPVLVKTESGGLGHVYLEDDPKTWARKLNTVLRTGYVVPVVVRDDEAEGGSGA